MESGMNNQLRQVLDHAINNLSASYRLDLMWLREKYRKRQALSSREYAVALIVLLDELTDEMVRHVLPKMHEITGSIPYEQTAALVNAIVGRYRSGIDQIITTVIREELKEHGLSIDLDGIAPSLESHVRSVVEAYFRCRSTK